MSSSKVIVFGPTGGVGSFVADALHEHKAKVILAMRDIAKPIPGLSLEQEATRGFERIQADLTQPDSVRGAVLKSGSTRAFIYHVFGSSDHMKSALVALKQSGIEYVVFLSSFSVDGDLAAIPPNEPIPYAHGQVEINLQEVFGTGHFMAVRPAWFASNSMRLKSAIQSSDVRIFGPDVKFDWITPRDIGSVCAALLSSGPSEQRDKALHYIKLCGPQLISQRDAVKIIADAVGRDVRVTNIESEDAVQQFVEEGIPEFIAKYLVKNMTDLINGNKEQFPPTVYNEAVENVRKYTKKAPMTFQEWVEQNKRVFA